MLNSLENFRSMMEGHGAERLPFELPMTPPVVEMMKAKRGSNDPTKAFNTDFGGIWVQPEPKPAIWREAYASLGFEVPESADINGYGNVHAVPELESLGAGTHFRELLHPLSVVTHVDQLEKLPWPDMSNPAIYKPLAGYATHWQTEKRAIVGHGECTIFESVWYLRGMDYFFSDIAEGNGISDWLLDWFTERSIVLMRAYVEAGADIIALGDDVGTQRGMMMSMDMWREHLKPRLKRVIDAIRAAQTKPVHIRYHSDGDIRPIIPELIEIGVDILNPIQPECMPVREVIKQYQDKLAFWGMVGTQTTMPFGSTEDVRAVVAECLDLARNGARLIVAPTHVLEPDVPWENIEALVDAVQNARL